MNDQAPNPSSHPSMRLETSGSGTGDGIDWIKVIGAVAVLYAAAKVVGWLLSPGPIMLGIAIAVAVRLHRKRQARQHRHGFVQATTPAPAMAAWVPPVPPASAWAPMPQSAAAPRRPEMWFPTHALHAATQPLAQPVAQPFAQPGSQSTVPFVDERSDAEREIEDYVQRSWPNV